MAEQTDWRETELTTEEVERLWETQRRRIEQEWALVIGIGAYQSDFRPLTNAPQDAKEVAKLLRDDYGFDLHPTGKPLLDEEAGLSAICQAVEETLAQAANRTRWMFYFAGHGVVVDGRGYLVPADAHKGETDSYLSLDWLRKRCLDAECAEILIVLDACYSGRALVRPEHFVDFIPDEREEERIRHLICSGSPDQPVLDGGGSGHSVFTQSLLEALQGWAGIHQESGIDFLSLWGYLVLDVPARLRSQGKNPAIQQPVGGNLIGSRWRLTLIATAPRLSPEIVRGARSEEPTYRQHNLARLVDEIQTHPPKRSLAVQMAQQHLRRPGEHPGPLVAGTLRYEPVVSVRAKAAETLGNLADPAAVESLTAALDDVPEVCRAAARALGQLADRHAIPALLDHLKTAGENLFLDLMGAIGAILDPVVLAEALREALRRGKLVPFVGPDFPARLTGLPDRATVARKLADLEDQPPGNSLAEIAEKTMHGGNNRFTFTAFMRQELDDQLKSPGLIHRALARLNLPFWISGAYDKLLVKALNANNIVSGQDTRFWQREHPTVLRLVGDLSSVRDLLVVESDYKQLRENEGDRRLLVSYLREQLQGQVVLFLGYDPQSPDLGLVVKHVLNHHLAGVDVRAFLVSPEARVNYRWGDWPIQPIRAESMGLVERLAGEG